MPLDNAKVGGLVHTENLYYQNVDIGYDSLLHSVSGVEPSITETDSVVFRCIVL